MSLELLNHPMNHIFVICYILYTNETISFKLLRKRYLLIASSKYNNSISVTIIKTIDSH